MYMVSLLLAIMSAPPLGFDACRISDIVASTEDDSWLIVAKAGTNGSALVCLSNEFSPNLVIPFTRTNTGILASPKSSHDVWIWSRLLNPPNVHFYISMHGKVTLELPQNAQPLQLLPSSQIVLLASSSWWDYLLGWPEETIEVRTLPDLKIIDRTAWTHLLPPRKNEVTGIFGSNNDLLGLITRDQELRAALCVYCLSPLRLVKKDQLFESPRGLWAQKGKDSLALVTETKEGNINLNRIAISGEGFNHKQHLIPLDVRLRNWTAKIRNDKLYIASDEKFIVYKLDIDDNPACIYSEDLVKDDGFHYEVNASGDVIMTRRDGNELSILKLSDSGFIADINLAQRVRSSVLHLLGFT